MRLFIACLLVMLAAAFAVSGETIVLGNDNSQDSWLNSRYDYRDTPGVTRDGKGVNDFKIQVGGWGDQYVALIGLNVTDDFPLARRATLRLYCFDRRSIAGDGGVPTAMYLCVVKSPWEESVTGWRSKPEYEFVREIPTPTINSWYEIDLTNIYNEMVDGARTGQPTCFGIALTPVNIGVVNQYPNFNVFCSSEYPDEQYRPQLIVDPKPESVMTKRVAVAHISGGNNSTGVTSASQDWWDKMSSFNFHTNLPPWFGIVFSSGGGLVALVFVTLLLWAKTRGGLAH